MRMNSKHAERWEELRKVNTNLAMEYLRIYTTMDKAQKHFNNFKKECNDWLDNIYKDGMKKMNKYKEALDEIKNIVLDKNGDGYHAAKYLQNFYYSSCETLQELVERATQKKLVATRHTRRCPACNRQMSDINNAHPNMKFCPNCGQALDWRDEDDC